MGEQNEWLQFDPQGSLFSLEYIERTGPFRMATDHYHNFYEMYVLLSGERRYFIRDRSYHIQPGDIVLVDKQAVHQTSDAGSPSHQRIVIYFYEAFLRQYYKNEADYLLSVFKRENPVCRLPAKARLQLDAVSERIMQELRARAPGQETAIRHAVVDLMLLAARHDEQEEAAPPLDTPLYRKMTEIAQFINSHYTEPLTLTELAGHFHISPYYLSRMFKQAIGLTLNEYLNITRIKEAEQLLKDTDMSILDVSAAVGYNNFSHFGKMFKKLTKVSPRTYRRG
ncbi:AraC family transcriptional regulator [Paenibacillus sambharensis]|uniref:AraC family transcriptional regulator n=1 Tax=Paenibacillus sambharensis TaxID=1803190 RepID=A0A2W1KZW2_9BACL|nr:AraC family transcriptional regulator [Paenibacillus sambharensis]PZD93228.1 AraC family transcriptional regulator [Paenibacillus sambharensis]